MVNRSRPKDIQSLETTGKNFKITIINILMCLAEKLNNKHEYIENFRKNLTMQMIKWKF